MRDSFVFYRGYKNALDYLDADTKVRLLEAIFNYALDDIEPELNGLERSFFELVRPQIDTNNKKYENGKKGAEFGKLGGRPKTTPQEENPTETPPKPHRNPTETPNVNDNVNGNVNDNVDGNVNESNGGQAAATPTNKQKRFVKPTVEEISAYCAERKNNIDAQHFFDFYESKGWKVGNQPMKDWKAAVRTWEQKSGGRRSLPSGSGAPISSNLIPNEIRL